MARGGREKFSANDLNGHELLWTGSPNVIVHYLMRPADPEKLRQQSLRNRPPLPQSADGRPGEEIVLLRNMKEVLTYFAESRPRSNTIREPPAKIHADIYDQLPLEYAICLVMSNTYMWNPSNRDVEKRLEGFVNSWVGSQLILTQTPELLVNDEMPSIAVRKPKTAASFAEWDAIGKHAGRTVSDLRKELKLIKNHWWPIGSVWVLRNLSKRQYISADKIALRPDFVQGPFVATPGFGDLLLLKTQSTGFTHAKEGPETWCGDRFDIVTADCHDKEVQKTGNKWADVSPAILEEWGSRQKKSSSMDWKTRCIRLHEMKLASNADYLLTEAGIML